MQSTLLFPVKLIPRAPSTPPPKDCKVQWVDAADGSSSEAWFFAGQGAAPKKPTVVIFHGNGEFINNYVAVARWFSGLGLNVLVPEYRGYGKSVGTPTEAGIVSDMEQHLRMLVKDPTVDADKLIYFGVSVGGGVGCALAVKRAPHKMVLQSTFYSMPRMAVEYLVPEFISRGMLINTFDNRRNIEGCKLRGCEGVLLAHGTRDSIVPFQHAADLSSELNLSLYTRECDHNDFYFDEAYRKRIIEFLL